MDSRVWEAPLTIAAGIIGVAIIAVLVSQRSQTPQVLGAAGSAFANMLSAATAPVTGNAATPNVNGPTSGAFGSISLPQLSLPGLSGNLNG